VEHLPAAAIAELRGRLEEEASRLRARLRGEVEDATHDGDPQDLQDDAAEEERRRVAYVRHGQDQSRLRQVEAALRRMDDGTYGVCEETGDEIPLARLRAEPTTRYTVEALEGLEREGRRAQALDVDGEPDPY
jgi:DnaK suppressor protein